MTLHHFNTSLPKEKKNPKHKQIRKKEKKDTNNFTEGLNSSTNKTGFLTNPVATSNRKKGGKKRDTEGPKPYRPKNVPVNLNIKYLNTSKTRNKIKR